jgi:hypothetical protein
MCFSIRKFVDDTAEIVDPENDFMTQAAPQDASPSLPPAYSPLAGLLSYLVPGLGQIVQGRIAKGLLFFVCLYGLFFTGMAMGDWKNVYLAAAPRKDLVVLGVRLPRFATDVWNRLHYAGQFWIGVAAWPALLQYNNVHVQFLGDFEREPKEDEESEINRSKGKLPDVAWVYTVIAGVLNILVIYDAVAGPAFQASAKTGEVPAYD